MFNFKKLFQKREILICILLLLVITFIYSDCLNHDFINFDDPVYVTENPAVQSGITFESITWAFGIHSDICMYWQPVAWISHMLDCEFFGLNPGKHHRTSIIFHILNSILLFFVLFKMTGAKGKSALAAAIFAIHPVNVDSVSWIAERKTVLSGFFWLSATLSYFYYTKLPNIKRYGAVLFLFTLGMLSKPVMITFPCALLLLDCWPLSRLPLNNSRKNFSIRKPVKLVIEKIPFFIVSGLWFVTPFLSKTLLSNETLPNIVPYSLRISNAIVAYSKYIYKFFYPVNLSIHYPYPSYIPLSTTIPALSLLIAITILFIYYRKEKPFLIIGWLWFAGVMFPSSGLILGTLWPEMADRWAYLPYIGFCIITVWGVAESNIIKKINSKIFLSFAFSALLIFTLISKKQTAYWKNSITIFSHASSIIGYNSLPHQNIAAELTKIGKYDQALTNLQIILDNEPENLDANYNAGVILTKKNDSEQALKYFQKVIDSDQEFFNAYLAIGKIYIQKNQYEKALKIYKKALTTKTWTKELLYNLSFVFEKLNRDDEAELYLIKLLKAKPSHLKGNILFAEILARKKNYEKALLHYLFAAKYNLNSSEAYNGAGLMYYYLKEYDKATESFKKVITIDPDYEHAKENLQNSIIKNIQRKK